MPAVGFAHRLIASAIGWNESRYRIDADETSARLSDLAVYYGDLKPEHFGEQGDLEWVYLVNLKARTITVWGCWCGDPAELRKRGPVDPRKYATLLRDDDPNVNYQGRSFLAIQANMTKLTRQGWTITRPKARGQGWLNKFLMKALDHVEQCVIDDLRTSAVVAMLAGMRKQKSLVAAPFLADALTDAGCLDTHFLDTLRTAA